MKRYFVDKDKIYEYAINVQNYTTQQLDDMLWIREMDGMEVYFPPELNITVVGGYYVHKDWCRELEVIK